MWKHSIVTAQIILPTDLKQTNSGLSQTLPGDPTVCNQKTHPQQPQDITANLKFYAYRNLSVEFTQKVYLRLQLRFLYVEQFSERTKDSCNVEGNVSLLRYWFNKWKNLEICQSWEGNYMHFPVQNNYVIKSS